MMGQRDARPPEPLREGKYARIERERRFLLAGPPDGVAEPRLITDRYITGTRLRLRRVKYQDSRVCDYKLTQKIPAGQPGPVRGLITNTYLASAEYDLLTSLPAAVLSKTRFSAAPLSIDVFDPPLHGLVLAEAEFSTDDAALTFRTPPDGIAEITIAEITDDERLTGGSLARARRSDLLGWLADYGIDADVP